MAIISGSTVNSRVGSFAARNWRAKAYRAKLASTEYQDYQVSESLELSEQLGAMIKLFDASANFDKLCDQLRNNCIEPAMRLYEKTLTYHHDICVSLNSFITKNDFGQYETSGQFYHALDELDCKDVYDNRKKFSMKKAPLPATAERSQARLERICAVALSLSMTRIGQEGTASETITIRKQQMLVGWDVDGANEQFCQQQSKNLIISIMEYRNRLARNQVLSGCWHRVGRLMPSHR